jgi:tetratricopeptide (TPR) repeat protein
MKSLSVILLLLLCSLVSVGQEKRLNASKVFALAEAAYNEGQYQKAIDYLDQCLLEDPGYSEAYFMRAGAREQLKNYEGALTDYSIFLEQKPDNPEALFSRAIIRYQLKKYEQAREDFTRLTQLPPGETQTIYFNKSASVRGVNQVMTTQSMNAPVIYNYLGMIDLRLKNFKTALAWLDSAILLDAREADYLVNRGLAYENLGDSSAALRDFQKALTINPQHTHALHNLAILNRTKEKKEPAQDPLELAIESDSSMLYPYLERARQRFEGGFYKGALADYTKALALEDKDPEIWLSRGLVRERMKDYNGAFSDYTKAIELKENHARAWVNRANVLLKLERYKDAIEDYSVALIYQPDFAAAYYNRAIAKSYLKQTTEACDDLKKAEALGMAVESRMKAKFCP